MTTSEQKTIDNLLKVVQDLRTENAKFREDVKMQVDSINNKTEKKHLPIYLEQDILQVAQQSVSDAIKSVLSGYNSPLSKLISLVVDENSQALRTIISDSFTQVIRKDEFKQLIIY